MGSTVRHPPLSLPFSLASGGFLQGFCTACTRRLKTHTLLFWRRGLPSLAHLCLGIATPNKKIVKIWQVSISPGDTQSLVSVRAACTQCARRAENISSSLSLLFLFCPPSSPPHMLDHSGSFGWSTGEVPSTSTRISTGKGTEKANNMMSHTRMCVPHQLDGPHFFAPLFYGPKLIF